MPTATIPKFQFEPTGIATRVHCYLWFSITLRDLKVLMAQMHPTG